jgi:hypothetical protein
MIVIVVPIVVATCPRIFQVTTAALRLAAVFTVLAFRIVQFVFRIADLLFAPSVVIVIAVHRSRGNGPAQKRQNYKRRNNCLGSFQHASSSNRLDIVLSWMHMPAR